MANWGDRRIYVDAHVHYYTLYDVEKFLDSAARNIHEQMRLLAPGGPATGCLLLADNHGQQTLDRIVEHCDRRRELGWRTWEPSEGHSLVCERQDSVPLVFIQGSQAISQEKIEVLWLASSRRPPESVPVTELIRLGFAYGATVVLPWGFAKWLGKRRALIESVIREFGHASRNGQQGEELYLGDNRGRLRGPKQPRVFEKARAAGMRVLAGSDPLPLVDHARHVAEYGCLFKGRFDIQNPASSVRRLLTECRQQPQTLGTRVSWLESVREQGRMQFRKYRRLQQWS